MTFKEFTMLDASALVGRQFRESHGDQHEQA